MKKFFLLLVLLLPVVSIFGQNDFKLRQRMTMAGRSMESTIMIKGARERTESSQSGMKNVTIMQCDLKRYVRINDIEKKYMIEPMVTDAPAVAPVTTKTVSKTKTTKGGTVTQTLEIIDTGERKQMFGLTARHIKTSMSIEPSPDACQKQATHIETDGWYVDLSFGLNCKFDGPVDIPTDHEKPSGCIDQTKLIKKGTGKLGYALQMTTKMPMPGMEDEDEETKAMMAKMGMGGGMTMTTEVVELSKAALPADLFDIPGGYTEVKEMSDLYGKATQKSMGQYNQSAQGQKETRDMMQGMGVQNAAAAGAKKPGMIRVGVMAVTNSSGKDLSTGNYRSLLVMQIKSDKVEAVEVSSAEQAKQLGCDYILNTDIKSLKQSTANKVGGLFGKVTGQGTGEGKVEATISYDLKPTGADGTTLSMQSTTAKIDGQENSIMMALGNEAQAIVKALKK